MKKGKGQVFYHLGSQFPVIAVVGLGKNGCSYNEQENIDEGQENVRIAASGMLFTLASSCIVVLRILHVFFQVLQQNASDKLKHFVGCIVHSNVQNKLNNSLFLRVFYLNLGHGYKAVLKERWSEG